MAPTIVAILMLMYIYKLELFVGVSDLCKSLDTYTFATHQSPSLLKLTVKH